MVFLLAYSLFLRLNINQQMVRKDFLQILNDPEKSDWICYNHKRRCHYDSNTTRLEWRQDAEEDRECESSEPKVTICHPDLELGNDSSAIVLLGLAVFFVLFLAVKAFWLIKDVTALKRRGHLYPKILTLVTLAVSILFTSIACYNDRQDISFDPQTPLVGCLSLAVIEIYVLLSSLWLLGNLCIKVQSNRVFKDNVAITFFKDPEIIFQWVTLLPAIVAVFAKNHLVTSTFFSGYLAGITAISIATATAVVVIKMGHSDNNIFSTFATTFHIILKKIPMYYLAIIYLLHGFSFGFWILENKAASEKEERSFNDYWRSGIEVIMMCFGLTEFDFGGPFKYTGLKFSSGSSVTVVFSYILLTLMVLLVMLGLLNLLLTTIIKDHKETKEEVILNNLIFMAQYAIYLEDCHRFWNKNCWTIARIIHCGQKTLKQFQKEETARFCTRSYCPTDVMEEEEKREKVVKHICPHFDFVVRNLMKIHKGEEINDKSFRDLKIGHDLLSRPTSAM